MILEIVKIPNGLKWDNQDRLFTNSIFEIGYEIQGIDIALIELDNEVFMLCSKDSSIDGIMFNNITDEINYIYEI
jgi:hypothetical protein